MIKFTAPSMIFGVGLGLLGCFPTVLRPKDPSSQEVQYPFDNTQPDGINQMKRQGRTMKIPNLRADRTPLSGWEIRTNDGIAVNAHQVGPPRISSRRSKWRLRVAADLDSESGRFLSVTSPTPGVEFLSAVPSGHKYAIDLEVVAPTMCPLREGDRKVELVFGIESSDGKTYLSVPVDDQCIVGEIIDGVEPQLMGRLAEKHAFDPVIDQLLVRAAPYPLSDVRVEVERLKEWIGFSRELVREDPPSIVGGWFGTAYILSPTQTLRLGGDCEDWALLVSGFLARRGYQTSLLYGAGHVWTRVRTGEESNAYVDIDLLIPKKDANDPLEVALEIK